MSKEQNVINYYLLCNKLKDVIRMGWISWGVKRERIESIAEHIFGVQMLAIAMKSEYKYDIDILKVIYMLAIHELGEIIIGDITPFEIGQKEKIKKEHEAVHKILKPLIDGKQIEKLFLEFDARETPEAKFAYQCDKLECDIQCKLYDQEGCVDLNHQEGNQIINNNLVKELLKTGCSWSNMWLEYGQIKKYYDTNFMKVSQYVKENPINDFFQEN
ncbi:MAG: HD domain-containing protein [Bacilli bacterium]|nr:HD domain-containing protein [Bacilli bacterium]